VRAYGDARSGTVGMEGEPSKQQWFIIVPESESWAGSLSRSGESESCNIGWVIAGAVLLLFSAVAISAGTISLLMKRMETRISKRIRERE